MADENQEIINEYYHYYSHHSISDLQVQFVSHSHLSLRFPSVVILLYHTQVVLNRVDHVRMHNVGRSSRNIPFGQSRKHKVKFCSTANGICAPRHQLRDAERDN